MKLKEKRTDGTNLYNERVYEEYPDVTVVTYCDYHGCGKWVHFFKYKGYRSCDLVNDLKESEIINFMKVVDSFENKDEEYKELEKRLTDAGFPTTRVGTKMHFLSNLFFMTGRY